MLTLRDFLVRGLIAGLIGGLAAFFVGYAIGEPAVEAAIAIEEAAGGHDHGTGAEAGEPEAEEDEGTEVSRPIQSTLGLATGMLVLGAALGGIAGIATGLSFGRFGRRSARATAMAVAGAGFVVLFFVPFLIYPPNPPAVGDGDTIGWRTGLYFAMLAVSVIAAALAIYLGRTFTAKLGAWYAGLVGVGTYLAIVLIAFAVMPRYDEVPSDFPPSLLYEFRLSSILTQVVLWVVIGAALGELTHRLHRSRAGARSDAELASIG